MAAVSEMLQSIVDSYKYYVYEKADKRTEGFPLIDSPWPMLIILAAYYNFIYYSGPKLMEKRKPFELKKVMIPYNVTQCVINTWAVFQGIKIFRHPEFDLTCAPINYSMEPFHYKMLCLAYIYYLVKIFDLLDTIFMVLRKNYHQVSFLHVYHHMGMVLGCWLTIKYLPVGQLAVVGLLNCFVHAVMYFYYLLTIYDKELKKSIWWKKHITKLQMLQFFLILVHHTVTLFNKNCNYPKVALYVFISQNFLIFYLFSKFYYNAYIRPAKKKES